MRRRFDYVKALRLHREGLSDRQIGERLGVSAAAIQKARKGMIGTDARVPAEALLPFIESWLLRQREDGGIDDLAWKAGIMPRTLWAIRTGEVKHVKFSTADRILVAVGRPDVWHVELDAYYPAYKPEEVAEAA